MTIQSIWQWTEEKGKQIYLTPSGYTDSAKRGGERGSNGLLLDKEGNLVLCQHGDRRIVKMNSPIDDPKPVFTTIVNAYNGKRINSPNDAVFNANGELFFTDPPYGLEKHTEDPKKEIPFHGVYKVKKNGEVLLLTDSITRPNGIAFLPGEKKLIVACSDPDKPNWYLFDAGQDDSLRSGRIFYSALGYDTSAKGLPDGLKVDRNGNVFATGPGGVWIFNAAGKVLGRLKLKDPASNCALAADEKTLYITNDNFVLRFTMRK